MKEPIRILLVDDHTLFRRGLAGILTEQPDFIIVGEAANGQDAIELTRHYLPDVILMDIHMPRRTGVEAVKTLKKELSTRIIMLTVSNEDDDLLAALAAGADGYLLKSTEPEELCWAIRQVASGKNVLSPDVTGCVMKAAANGPQQSVQLSSREHEVLLELAQGATTAEIAETLTVSRNTVRTHVRNLLKKLEATNRAEAVARASAFGLLSSPD